MTNADKLIFLSSAPIYSYNTINKEAGFLEKFRMLDEIPSLLMKSERLGKIKPIKSFATGWKDAIQERELNHLLSKGKNPTEAMFNHIYGNKRNAQIFTHAKDQMRRKAFADEIYKNDKKLFGKHMPENWRSGLYSEYGVQKDPFKQFQSNSQRPSLITRIWSLI